MMPEDAFEGLDKTLLWHGRWHIMAWRLEGLLQVEDEAYLRIRHGCYRGTIE